jgi:hypothetical protein
MVEIDKFLTAQIHAIEKSVYIDSEKANRNLRYDCNGNPTEEYFIHWIDNHSEKFRDAWNISVCKNCKNLMKCNDCLKEKCNMFDSEEQSKWQ